MPIPKNPGLYYLGIDPGLSGGMAVVTAHGPLLATFPFAKATNHEIAETLEEWSRRYRPRAVLEKVGAMPGQGVCAMFTFGVSYGFLQGLLTAFQIPFIDVRPQKWQQRLSISPRKKTEGKPEFKKRLQAKAHQRWPSRIKELTLATSDAALIAEYLRLEEVGDAKPKVTSTLASVR
jgi:hypothetical protein